jgi:hypothetical protein
LQCTWSSAAQRAVLADSQLSQSSPDTAAPRGAVAILIVALIPVVIWGAQVYYRSTAEIPATLIGRAVFLAHGLHEPNVWQSELVFDGSTDDAALRWLETLQNELDSARKGAASEVAVHVVFENSAERIGCVVIDFRKPGVVAAEHSSDEESSPDSKPRFLRVVTFRLLNADSGWLLDGRRTLRDYKTTSS